VAGDRTIEMTVNDGDLDSNTATSMITVNAVNDAAILDLNSVASEADTDRTFSASFTENGSAVAILDANADILDVDDTNLESATVSLTNIEADDRFLFNGTPVTSNTTNNATGVTGLTFDVSADGATLTFNGSAAIADYTSVLKLITFENTSENPVAGDRTIEMTVNDGDIDSNLATSTITVARANDAPILDNTGTMVFTDVNKDNTDPLGESVATLIASAGGDRITDIDLGAVEGIAVTAVDDTNGTWQFSTDSGTSWTAFGAISSSSAVVLDDSALIRFLPDGVFNGVIDPGITFHAWDTSDGLASGTTNVNAITTGGTSAFSIDSETASIEVVLESAPIATDDTYTVLVTETLTKVTGDADDLLDNDDVGSPDAGTIVSFSGGTSAGSSISFAGGSLTVNDDGSFSLVNPTTTGDYSFNYQITNSIGSDTGTVSIQVRETPVAVDDTVTAASNPGDTYHTALNTVLNVPDGATDVLANDTLGFPVASLNLFGANTADTTAGTAGATTNGGTLTVNADGSFDYIPPSATFTGEDTFVYQIDNGVVAPSTATVTLAVGDRPDAITDNYTSIGNVGINVGSADGVLTNDIGDVISLIGFGDTAGTANNTVVNDANTITTSNGGTVLLNSDGSFVYTPDTGYVGGTDSFFYTIENGFGTVTGQVDITVDDIVWFIDSSASTSSNEGTITNPFTSLNDFASINDNIGNNPGTDAIIYLAAGSGDYTGGLTLLDGQRLIGQGASSSIEAITGITVPTYTAAALPTPDGTSPVMVNASGNGITLASTAGTQGIYGVDIGTTSGAGIAGDGFGTLTLRDVSITGDGRLLNLANGTVDATFTELLSFSSSGGAAIALDGISTTGNHFQVNSETTPDTSISTTSAGGIDIRNSGAGATFNFGDTEISESGTGVNLLNNTGASITFGTLNITESTSGNGMVASGGGTITTTGGALNVTGGSALNLDGVSATLAFNSLSSTNSSTKGINLSTLADGSIVNVANGTVNIQNATEEGIYISAPSANITVNMNGASVSINNAGNESIEIGQVGAGSTLDFGSATISNRNSIGVLMNGTGGSVDFDSVSINNPNTVIQNAIQINNSIADFTVGNIQIDDGQTDAIALDTYSGNFTINAGNINHVSGAGILGTSVTGTFNLTDFGIGTATTGIDLTTAMTGSLAVNMMTSSLGDFLAGGLIEETGLILTANGDSVVSLNLNGDAQNFQIRTNGFETTDQGVVINANDTSTVTLDLAEFFIRTEGTGVVLNQVVGTQVILPGYTGTASGNLSGAIATYLTNAGGQDNDLSFAAIQVDAQSMTNVTG
jgi:hypothetical protein